MLAESDPDISELYLPAEYEHQTIVLRSAKKGAALLTAVFEPGEAVTPGESESNGIDDIEEMSFEDRDPIPNLFFEETA